MQGGDDQVADRVVELGCEPSERDVQRLVMENAFVAPLAFQFELVAMNKKVQGYRPNLLGKPKYDDVWLES